ARDCEPGGAARAPACGGRRRGPAPGKAAGRFARRDQAVDAQSGGTGGADRRGKCELRRAAEDGRGARGLYRLCRTAAAGLYEICEIDARAWRAVLANRSACGKITSLRVRFSIRDRTAGPPATSIGHFLRAATLNHCPHRYRSHHLRAEAATIHGIDCRLTTDTR